MTNRRASVVVNAVTTSTRKGKDVLAVCWSLSAIIAMLVASIAVAKDISLLPSETLSTVASSVLLLLSIILIARTMLQGNR